MNEHLTLHVSRDSRNTAIGKALVLIAFGGFCGYFYDKGVTADNLKASRLTLLEYTHNYETYKASLIQPDWPLWGHLVLVLVLVGVFFATYEILGWGVGWLIGRLGPLPSGLDSQARGEPPSVAG